MYGITLADGTSGQVCQQCSKSLQALQDNPSHASSEVVELVEAAEQDLVEAAKLEPGSEPIQKNLLDVRKLLENVGGRDTSARKAQKRKSIGMKWLKWTGLVLLGLIGLLGFLVFGQGFVTFLVGAYIILFIVVPFIFRVFEGIRTFFTTMSQGYRGW